jgi:uncharacterized protein (TIGR02996 family)
MSDEEKTRRWSKTEERMAVAEVAMQTEPELLAAIDHQDHETRTVYADWLEEHGDAQRAEFVRLQDVLVTLGEGIERDACMLRLQEIAWKVDMAWRVLVARPRIEPRCDGDACPREWGSLAPSDRTDVRICMTCNHRVYYAATLYDAQKLVADRKRVCVDAVTDPKRDELVGWDDFDEGMTPPWTRR